MSKDFRECHRNALTPISIKNVYHIGDTDDNETLRGVHSELSQFAPHYVSGVIIDATSMVSERKLDSIYRAFARQACADDNFFFVLLE